MTGQEFKEAIERVHEKHVGGESRHGALTWFGEWCHRRTGRAVYDWTVREVVPDGPHLVVLAMLEVLPRNSRSLAAIRQEVTRWLPT